MDSTAQVEVEMVSERGGNNEIMEETEVEIVLERSDNESLAETEVRFSKSSGNNEQVEYEHDIDQKGARANRFSEKIIRKLDQVPREFRKNYIFKVDDVTRKGHENHYEPILLAIGPYHRGKSNLQPMEEHKWQCLNRMIERASNRTCNSRSDLIKRCYEVLEGLEDEARGYYADDIIGLDSSEFLEMLLLDGCFLVNALCTTLFDHGDDPLIYKERNLTICQHDILLIENQLPFFILEKLHDVMITDNDEKGSSLLLLLSIKSPFVHGNMIRPVARYFHDYMNIVVCVFKHFGKVEDLLDEYPEELKQYISDLAVQEKRREVDPEKLKNTKHLLELMYKVLLCEDELLEIPVATSTTIQMVSPDESSMNDNFLNNLVYYNTYSVTELSNAGVKFKSVDKRKFYDIQFKNGTLEIPTINIDRNETEGVFRNLMAYEIGTKEDTCILTDYVTFMDSLINSEKDVELLRIHGIIEHFLGDDEAVSTMFNNIGAIANVSGNYYYSNTVKQLKHHCKKSQNVWMAKLRSDYFSSPWTIISVMAAFVLLVLTIIQTVYSPLSYYKG